jgi:hypothetical protein
MKAVVCGAGAPARVPAAALAVNADRSVRATLGTAAKEGCYN